MKIVLDANILIAAVMGSRSHILIITSYHYQFYVPRKIMEEVKKYKTVICERTGYTAEEFKKLKKSKQFVDALDQKIKRLQIDPNIGGYLAGSLHGYKSIRLVKNYRILFKIDEMQKKTHRAYSHPRETTPNQWKSRAAVWYHRPRNQILQQRPRTIPVPLQSFQTPPEPAMENPLCGFP